MTIQNSPPQTERVSANESPVSEPLLGKLRPAGGNNAIVNVSFGIAWENERNDDVVQAMHSSYTTMKAKGYEGMPIKGVALSFEIGRDVPQFSTRSIDEIGYTYTKKVADKATREMTLRGSELTITVHQYDSWSSVWAEVLELFHVVSGVLARKRVISVTLQFIDRFDWLDHSPFPIDRVLKESKYFAKNILVQTEPFHSHHGHFKKCAVSGFQKRLDNANVSVNAGHVGPTLTFLTQYKYVADRPEKVANPVGAMIAPCFETAHTDNVTFFSGILTTEVCKMIDMRCRDDDRSN